MIRHIVLTKFRAEVTKAEIDSLFAKLADLQNHIPDMRSFDGGVSVSSEGLEQGFRLGFSIDFDDAKARDAYLEQPVSTVTKLARKKPHASFMTLLRKGWSLPKAHITRIAKNHSLTSGYRHI